MLQGEAGTAGWHPLTVGWSHCSDGGMTSIDSRVVSLQIVATNTGAIEFVVEMLYVVYLTEQQRCKFFSFALNYTCRELLQCESVFLFCLEALLLLQIRVMTTKYVLVHQQPRRNFASVKTWNYSQKLSSEFWYLLMMPDYLSSSDRILQYAVTYKRHLWSSSKIWFCPRRVLFWSRVVDDSLIIQFIWSCVLHVLN